MIAVRNGAVELGPGSGRFLRCDFSLDSGDLAVLVGSNGSGKTSCLDVIAGARALHSGILEVAHPRRPICYAVQESAAGLLPWYTIEENILLPAELSSADTRPAKDYSSALLREFGIAHRAADMPYSLSGGEKQIVNYVRLLSTPGEVFLLDEAFSAMHKSARSIAKKALLEWRVGKTGIVVTHVSDDLDLPFNRWLAIEGGSVVEGDEASIRMSLGEGAG